MKAASIVGYLFLTLLLVGCSGETLEQPIIELSMLTTKLRHQRSHPRPKNRVISIVRGRKPAAPVIHRQPAQPDLLGRTPTGRAHHTSIDAGYVISGEALSADDCEPIPGAQIEPWFANPQSSYDDAYRATLLAGDRGEYRFQSNFPGTLRKPTTPYLCLGASTGLPGVARSTPRNWLDGGDLRPRPGARVRTLPLTGHVPHRASPGNRPSWVFDPATATIRREIKRYNVEVCESLPSGKSETPELLERCFSRIGQGELPAHDEEMDLSEQAKAGDEQARGDELQTRRVSTYWGNV